MDSITHALYRAIAAASAAQAGLSVGNELGLAPLAQKPKTWEAYAGADGTNLHISLDGSPEVLALQLEFVAGGYCPPASLYTEGAEVIISAGQVVLLAPLDNGNGTWEATLGIISTVHSRRAGWAEQVKL